MHNSCRHCGKETEEGMLYCSQCAPSAGARTPRKIWLFAIIFSLLLVVLAVTLIWNGNCCTLDLSWDSLTGKPAAVINGEEIRRADLQARLKIARRVVERQYGKDIFEGQAGKIRLASLKGEILDRIMEERLISQEANRLGIRISDAEVDREFQRIGSELSGADGGPAKMLEEDGISRDAFKNHIRNVMTFQALASAKLAQAGKDIEPDAFFAGWLLQVKKAATVVVYDAPAQAANFPTGGGGCCGTGGNGSGPGSSGCGGGRQQPGPVDEATAKKAQEAAMAAYGKTNGNAGSVQARVSDYGCHIQVDIEEKGKAVKSYTYKDGTAYEL